MLWFIGIEFIQVEPHNNNEYKLILHRLNVLRVNIQVYDIF